MCVPFSAIDWGVTGSAQQRVVTIMVFSSDTEEWFDLE